MTARNELWAEVVKKVRVPKIDQTKLAIKGDKSALRVITADIDTYKALKEIAANRENVRRIQTRKPMVMIYDIDRDLTVEEIKDLIKTQNQELTTGKKELERTPLFRRGPRDSPTVWWVCEVEPSLHEKLLKLGKLYIGLAKCRVQEYFDVTQCFGCCKFGHKQAECRSQKVVCSFCGELGHKK
ncbi:Reverse transcriptase domain-containing protein [Aphis craccivora]|uniref:Reverse transcriptase domain-containing protein n=1 Tax=Aphis craccivora TaxID=307492 RepID=A0A6G0VXQ9_APHCR|nr:Reverse transcriptase domain-containing protein [Aphis craccivora]